MLAETKKLLLAMNNLTTFALDLILYKGQLNMTTTQQETQTPKLEKLSGLRKRALELVEQEESEDLLAEVIGVLSGAQLPCSYSHEQMEAALREAEIDFQNGRYVSHSSICDRYGSDGVYIASVWDCRQGGRALDANSAETTLQI